MTQHKIKPEASLSQLYSDWLTLVKKKVRKAPLTSWIPFLAWKLTYMFTVSHYILTAVTKTLLFIHLFNRDVPRD